MNSWQQLLRQRGLQERPVYALCFKHHWRKTLQSFAQGSRIHHVSSTHSLPANAVLMVWGQQPVSVPHQSVALIRWEDGFLRSVGLGAEFAQPLSWVADGEHLYFDSRGPSRLETWLANHQFTAEEQDRGMALIERLNNSGLSKYNVGTEDWQVPETDKQIILVPGQVESDASIAFGVPVMGADSPLNPPRTNMDLLKLVRTENPDAWIVYKPHPDVLAGARQPGCHEDQAERWADQVVGDVAINELLPCVDSVHTMTSLTGFEALVRGKSVYCYGLPFYAGWGLTTDYITTQSQIINRRQRRLSLEELVYGALVNYPFYLSPKSHTYISPEQAIEELKDKKTKGSSWKPVLGKWARRMINILKAPT